MEIKIEFKSEKELKEEKKKPKVIKSLADLRKLLEEENPRFSYGGVEFGAQGSSEEPESEEESAAHEADPNDVTEDRNEGEQELTPDDKAEKEDKETRVKNSKNPTVVGRMMK